MSKRTVVVTGSNATRTATMALLSDRFDVVPAMPNGTKPHFDEATRPVDRFGADELAYDQAEVFYADHPAMNRVRTLRSVIDEGLNTYARVFVSGGQAAVVDLMQGGLFTMVTWLPECRRCSHSPIGS